LLQLKTAKENRIITRLIGDGEGFIKRGIAHRKREVTELKTGRFFANSNGSSISEKPCLAEHAMVFRQLK
jgi:hypothetical protein